MNKFPISIFHLFIVDNHITTTDRLISTKMDQDFLTWHAFPDYLREVMKDMITSENFADVTLVSDDKKTIKDHKSILSACSTGFNNILYMESKTTVVI